MSIGQKVLKILNINLFHKSDEDRAVTAGDLIDETLGNINKEYQSGLISHLQERPEDWARMLTIEGSINRAALENDREGLIEALKEYESFFDNMTQLFTHSTNTVATPQEDTTQNRNRREVEKEMKVKDMFPSKYLNKEDITEPRILTIRDLVVEDIKDEEGIEPKPVLYFEECGDRGLILNKTNATTLEDLYGDSDDWPGNAIEVYVDPNIHFGSKKMGGVRLREPTQPSHQQELQV